MDQPLRRPHEILAYRSLRQILAGKPDALWTVGPEDNVFAALQLMADKNIGFLLVIEDGTMVGVLSERDCVRRVLLEDKSPESTHVKDIMVGDVITAELAHTYADGLRLMHAHGIRHLPIMEKGAAVGVISIRDLLREAVNHHAKVISELERERMTMLTSTA